MQLGCSEGGRAAVDECALRGTRGRAGRSAPRFVNCVPLGRRGDVMQGRIPRRTLLGPLPQQSSAVLQRWQPRALFGALPGVGAGAPSSAGGAGEAAQAPPGLSTDARAHGRLEGSQNRFHSQVMAMVNAAQSGAVSGAQISDATACPAAKHTLPAADRAPRCALHV